MTWKKCARLKNCQTKASLAKTLVGVCKANSLSKPDLIEANRKKGKWVGKEKNDMKKAVAVEQPRQEL
jgi:hypothetical protein